MMMLKMLKNSIGYAYDGGGDRKRLNRAIVETPLGVMSYLYGRIIILNTLH